MKLSGNIGNLLFSKNGNGPGRRYKSIGSKSYMT